MEIVDVFEDGATRCENFLLRNLEETRCSQSHEMCRGLLLTLYLVPRFSDQTLNG